MQRKISLLAFLYLLFFSAEAQNISIKGKIKNYPADAVCYTQLEVFNGAKYERHGNIAIIKSTGEFELSITDVHSYATALLCFNTGDTIQMIVGERVNIDFSATWQYGKIHDHSFYNSIENTTFQLIKNEQRKFIKREDSIGYLGMDIYEFDPQYQNKSNGLKAIYQQAKVEYNKALFAIQKAQPALYCSRAIVPVLLASNMADLTTQATTFDNNRSFQHYHFFHFVNAQETDMLSNPFLKRKITDYINLWVSQSEKGLREGVDIVMKKFSENESVSKYCLGILIDYFSEKNNYPVLDYINSKYMNTCEAPALSAKSAEVMEQMKRLSKGNPAPEITMGDENGNTFNLSEIKPKKYVVLFFWASWCPHCVEMMPKVIEMYNTRKAEGLDIIGISLDNDKVGWVKFIKANKLPWLNISDLKRWESSVVKSYALRGTPTFYALDNSLKILGRTNDLDELKALIP